ncbi:hypothetical protein GF326_10665 [Candidatus Bathyarchaeota archaeon]|nr:hypothetical protein [Candidatus Bathyarchaeota archaeon]
MSCSICGEEVSDNAIRIEKDGVTHLYCCSGCLYESPELEGFRHRNISSIVLNKTLFEVLAIITGFGGVYYTLFETANRALIMDTFSVAAALLALFIGVEHLRYVEEHDLLKRTVIYVSVITIIGFIILVWHYGFR